MNTKDHPFGSRIEELLEVLGLAKHGGKKALAQAMGVQSQRLSFWMTRSVPRPEDLNACMARLSVAFPQVGDPVKLATWLLLGGDRPPGIPMVLLPRPEEPPRVARPLPATLRSLLRDVRDKVLSLDEAENVLLAILPRFKQLPGLDSNQEEVRKEVRKRGFLRLMKRLTA